VQARLADAATARDGLLLSAWAAADPEGGVPRDALAWAGSACREVTAHVQQIHGGIGFALEGGIHRYYRRAKSVQVWTDVVLARLA
jgi:alkylation response protein AidB-like acyl-CoA dehydrogenase